MWVGKRLNIHTEKKGKKSKAMVSNVRNSRTLALEVLLADYFIKSMLP